MIKMLVLDIDGTVYKKDFTASDKVKSCLKDLIVKGIKVVLATGRMYSATVPIARELGINTPVICYQGGLIKEFYNSDKTLYEKMLPPALAREIIKNLKDRNIHFNLYIDDILIVENDSETIRRYTDERKVTYKVINSINDIDLNNVNKILAIDPDPQKIEKLTKELQKQYKDKLYIIRSMPIFCEFSNKDATKGNAIKFLADLWKIRDNEIMAIGDQDNDIEMLSAAGVKVAMGNATSGLKEVADFITESVDNDGVCVAIDRFIN